MPELKAKHRRTIVYDTYLHFVSDIYNGEVLDTKVYIGGEFACVIAGCNIDKFIEEFTQLITRYRI
jgi:hypothetical protein